MEVIITDTVGFIRDLPEELLQAFKATLEELKEADLLLHVIDVSNPCYQDHIRVVETILRELDLGQIPVLKVYNKMDRLDDRTNVEELQNDGVLISAIQPESLQPLLTVAQQKIRKALS